MAMTVVILIWYTTAMIQYHRMSPRTETTVNWMMMKINQVPADTIKSTGVDHESTVESTGVNHESRLDNHPHEIIGVGEQADIASASSSEDE
eukprot:8699685-Ditylum_brightwellii.AAC.1